MGPVKMIKTTQTDFDAIVIGSGISGGYAAFAMLAAIRRREQTGEGIEVRIPLSDVAIGTVANIGGIAEVLHKDANRPRLRLK